MPILIAIIGAAGAVIAAIIGRWRKSSGPQDGPQTKLAYWLGRPRSLSGNFVGRQSELSEVAQAFKKSRAVVLSGGPGVGKSQLAAEYTYDSKRNGYWSAAGDSPTRTLAALARDLGIDQKDLTEEDISHRVSVRLRALPSKTLWVIDNLGNLDQLNGILASSDPVGLLVTSRDGRKEVLPADAAFRPVGGLDPEPAVRLLCRGSGHDPADPRLREIAEEVGRLASALEMLSVGLRTGRHDPASLLAELRRAPTQVEFERFKQTAEGANIPNQQGVFAAIRGPLEALPPELRQSLSPVGYTADLPLSLSFLKAMTGLDDDGMERLLDECSRRSIITVTSSQATVHSLTVVAVAATNAEGSIQQAVRLALARLSSMSESDVAAMRAELPHHQQIYSWAARLLPEEDKLLLVFSNSLAIVYRDAGRYAEAIPIFEATLKAFERVLGPEHPDTLGSGNNLANAYGDAGRFTEAIPIHEATLKIRERVLGPEHPDTLASRNNLAIVYRDAGRYAEAIPIHEATLKIRERVLGPEHPDTLASRNNLANAYGDAGRFTEAIPIHEATLKIRERELGPEHPNTLTSRNNLANAYLDAGRYAEAIPIHEATLRLQERVLGPEHPDTLASRNNLANAYRGAGRHAEAIPIFEATLKSRERVLGPEHPHTLTSRNNLAIAYYGAGRNQDADALLKGS